jgi:hypothetical protein
MHEVQASSLAATRWHGGGTAVERQPFAPSDPHPDLQPFEAVQAAHALAIDRPALAPQERVNALVADPWPRERQLPNP